MIKKRIDSFGYAVKGIKSAFKSEAHIKIQVLMGFLALTGGFIFNISNIEWCLVITCVVLVITGELFNTAIEKIMDHISPEQHPVVGYIKDISAGAVLITALGSAVVGAIIFIPKIIILSDF